jgi:hypothetical protein
VASCNKTFKKKKCTESDLKKYLSPEHDTIPLTHNCFPLKQSEPKEKSGKVLVANQMFSTVQSPRTIKRK